MIDFTGDDKTKSKPYICKGSFYTAITRATKGEDVYLKDFDSSYIQVNTKTEEVIEAMRKFRLYPFYKVYVEDKVFVNDKLELKIGYLNINDLTAEFHAEYVNADKNLTKLDLLALADTRLGAEHTQSFCADKLDNFNALKRFDVCDGTKHMGMVLLLSKCSDLKHQIPEDLIDCFEESKMIQRGPHMGKKLSFVQGSILWIKEHYIKICFLYFRERPTERELLRASKYWKGCDLIMGDFNLKPNIPEDLKLLNHICGDTHILALGEMTTVHGQPDHIILHKRFELKHFSTSYLNFISDHNSIVVRMGLEQNSFDSMFLEKINFNSEKHIKKLKSPKEHPIQEKEEKKRGHHKIWKLKQAFLLSTLKS